MPSALALLPYLAPALLLAAAHIGRLDPGMRPERTLWASRAATIGALAVALLSGLLVALYGPATSPLIGFGSIGLSVRLDALSAVMFGLVSFVGVIVVQFSRNYLAGDPRHGAFLGGLCLTLAAVCLLVLSGNLMQLLLAWIGTSLALHRLLLFYPERPTAVVAARKKFIAARLGDGLLIIAAALLFTTFSSADIATILERARTAAPGTNGTVSLAAGLIAFAALFKSAQFPTHGWLTEVMETPTPVSALLHAGIVNAGGFLVIRFADVMVLSMPSLYVLAIVGGFTALFGSIAMLTQTSVKVSLAWSTVAQMGFMLLQCGFGAFSSALLHILAHSVYKAHAFLSSGSVVEIARASWIPSTEGRPGPARVLISVAGSLGLFVGIGYLVGASIDEKPAILALGAILVMGLTHLLAQVLDRKPNGFVIGRTLVSAALVSTLYFGLQEIALRVLGGTVPKPPVPDAMMIGVMVLAVASFGLVMVLQILAPYRADQPRWRTAYVLMANGFYANALFNRMVGALRLGRTVGRGGATDTGKA